MITDKNCPFCGSTQIEWFDEDCGCCSDVKQFALVCNILKGGCGATGGYRDTEEEAIEVWNQRI